METGRLLGINNRSTYWLKISNIEMSDAGIYMCTSEKHLVLTQDEGELKVLLSKVLVCCM